MAIFVDENTKVVVVGLTGNQGSYYGLLNRSYGTQVVAGVNPKKVGTDVQGIPIRASVADAVAQDGANVAFIIVPASVAGDAILEAAAGGVPFIVCVTEHITMHRQAEVFNTLKRDYPNTYAKFTAIGPLFNKLGNGGKGISWNTEHEVDLLRRLNGEVLEEGTSKGMAKIDSAIDACEVILSLAPETNGKDRQCD